MQLKMESTTTPVNTPKANKKTPKKVKVTPKTPKSNKKSPNPNANSTTPKPENNSQQNQKKTPQKGKQNQETGSKTPQIKPNTPKIGSLKKTPKSNSKFAKKQKLDDDTFKGIEAEKQDTNESNITKVSNQDILLFFPKRWVSAANLLSIFSDCESVSFPGKMNIRCNRVNMPKKIEQLQGMEIDGKSLRFRLGIDKSYDSLKRTVWLPSPRHKENVKNFFNAKSIEQIPSRNSPETKIYVLTFETKEEADAASNKQFNVGTMVLSLRQYFVRLTPQDLVEKALSTGNKGPSESKESQKKAPQRQGQGQVKRKVEEEEENEESDDENEGEESDEENDDEESDHDLDGALTKGIDMEDDDDDDDDENEDDDDDDGENEDDDDDDGENEDDDDDGDENEDGDDE